MYHFLLQPTALVLGILLTLFSLLFRAIVGNLIVKDFQEQTEEWMELSSFRVRSGSVFGAPKPVMPSVGGGYNILYAVVTYLLMYPSVLLALGSLGVMIHASFAR